MTTTIRIEFISTAVCNRCDDARKRLHSLIDELNDERVQYREIDVLEELDYAVSLGVLITPTIAIDSEIVFTAIPSLKRLRDELQKRLGSK